MNIYLHEDNLTQEQFDSFKEDIKHVTINGGGYCGINTIYLNKESEPIGTTALMEGYWDFDDEGGSCPHFWYNKKELDKHNIEYNNG